MSSFLCFERRQANSGCQADGSISWLMCVCRGGGVLTLVIVLSLLALWHCSCSEHTGYQLRQFSTH